MFIFNILIMNLLSPNVQASDLWPLGVTLYILSIFAMAGGIICQKLAANGLSDSKKVDSTPLKESDMDKAMTKSPMFWAGMLLWICGSIGMGVALGFAPLSLLSPLRACLIIINMLLGYFFLKKRWELKKLSRV